MVNGLLKLNKSKEDIIVKNDKLSLLIVIIGIIFLSLIVVSNENINKEFFLFFLSLIITSVVFNFLVTDENMIRKYSLFKYNFLFPALVSLVFILLTLGSIFFILKLISSMNFNLTLKYLMDIISYNLILLGLCVIVKTFDKREVESYRLYSFKEKFRKEKNDVIKDISIGFKDYIIYLPIFLVTIVLSVLYGIYSFEINLFISLLFALISLIISFYVMNRPKYIK